MTRPVPAAPGRDLRLDILRSWLQVSIFASHATGTFAGAWLIHAAWGLSDSSEQFVFLSGMALGSVFARKTVAAGWRAAAWDMLRRAARLWRTHLVVMALFGAMLLAVDLFLPGEARAYGWGFLIDSPLTALLAAAAMLYQPSYVDALSVFVWSMLALPAFMWAVGRVNAWALLPPSLLWAAAQTGRLPAPDLSGAAPPAFDPFAWQLLFMLGAWIGQTRLLHGTALPRRGWMLPAALLALAAGLLIRLSQHGILTPVLPQLGLSFEEKAVLSPVRLLHALALTYAVARLLPAEAPWMRGLLPRLLARVGRHSLQVFCAGLFLSYGVGLALRLAPASSVWLDPILIAAGLAALLAWPWGVDRPLNSAYKIRPGSRMARPAGEPPPCLPS